jgi:hypothetical protein
MCYAATTPDQECDPVARDLRALVLILFLPLRPGVHPAADGQSYGGRSITRSKGGFAGHVNAMAATVRGVQAIGHLIRGAKALWTASREFSYGSETCKWNHTALCATSLQSDYRLHQR